MRYYIETPQRKKILQEAQLALRQARRMIDPAVLENMRKAIFTHMRPEDLEKPQTCEVMDRKKNLATIMKFIEIKGNDPAFLGKIRTLLQE